MKMRSVLTLLAFVTIALFSCGKKNSSGSSAATSTQWTLNDTTYKGVTTTYDASNGSVATLAASDASGNFISVVFYSHPSANSTYIVTNGSNVVTTDCLIEAGTAGGAIHLPVMPVIKLL